VLVFDTIILLTGPKEQPALAAALRGHRADLEIVPAMTREDLLAIEETTLRRARLVAFASPVIVPPSVLDRLGYNAVNFHPGPPDYPGFCPAQFAIYDDARRFGSTAHLMVERVDEGPIIDVITFEVPCGTTVLGLEILSYRELARLFWRNAARLALDPGPPEALPIAWSGEKSSKSKYRALCAVPLDADEAEVKRRIAAFGGAGFGISLTVTLHGAQFAYAAPIEAQPPE
jgi:methionyl-tRNA formyltransferase